MTSRRDITLLLHRWKEGDREALDAITSVLYADLRRIAAGYLSRERPGHTLQATALVNEAYVRFAKLASLDWQDRAHFLGIAAHLMRQILVQHARAKHAAKRGGDGERVTLNEGLAAATGGSRELMALDDALQELERVDERRSKMIEMKYFGGMTAEEIAEVNQVSVSTVTRQLRLAEAWLYNYVAGA